MSPVSATDGEGLTSHIPCFAVRHYTSSDIIMMVKYWIKLKNWWFFYNSEVSPDYDIESNEFNVVLYELYYILMDNRMNYMSGADAALIIHN